MSKLLLLLAVLISTTLASAREEVLESGPELLTFNELITLSNTDQPAPPLAEKLDRILNTPFRGGGPVSPPRRPVVDGVGPVLRIASWNIERGVNFDLIRLALSDPDGFMSTARQRGPLNAGQQSQIQQQLGRLRDADIVLLNEADFGIKRTEYRDVARELARALGMTYVFGVEFVEVDRLDDLGLDNISLEDPELTQRMRDVLKPDPVRYLGLHGNAILSRYPLQNVRLVRLPECHDWYKTEKGEISKLEQGKRVASNKVFLERIDREVRRGGRMAIIADARIPDLPGGVATVVNVHLENRCKPECRTKQMDALLSQIRDVHHVLIMGGDLNTSGTDGTPTSIRRELLKRLRDYEFWVTQALRWGTPASLPLAALTPVKYFRNYLDPTSPHVPVVGNNKEAILFRHIEQFRFVDGYAFDFRGESDRNLENRGGTLANSNQRARKGFEPTFTIKRDFGGLVGNYKLDWFFVKPFIPSPRGEAMSHRFAPQFPITMRTLNNAVLDGVSDHPPIVVDVPLSHSE
jgi:endonuclease/exonuclease/phosphatase family metal-dependent hydrolase